MDITKELPTNVLVQDPNGKEFEHVVEYEWKPQFCNVCLKMGHSCQKQPQQIKQADQIERQHTSKNKYEWQAKRPNQNAGSVVLKESTNTQTEVLDHQDGVGTKNGQDDEWQTVKAKSAEKNTGKGDEVHKENINTTNGFKALAEVSKTVMESSEMLVQREGQFIYGLHTVRDKQELWAELKAIHSREQVPWVAMGDYNVVLNIDDRIYGNPVQETEVKDFRKLLDDTGMAELKTIMDPHFSDHSPLCLNVEVKSKRKPIPFRLSNYMAEHEEFLTVLKVGWAKRVQGNQMERIWAKLKEVKQELKKLFPHNKNSIEKKKRH
ncbi:uncharacterized protein LOC142180122 [Nicotiana tabacum]|uniref:Uncharacterized protein LOC142180122 n=1 Tax=Nicotiana tabacum TaxID=4097 RepID=A0AC58UCD5_TOBAC